MKSRFLSSIIKFFSVPKKTFLLSDCDAGMVAGRAVTSDVNIDVDFYADYKKLLLRLHKNKNHEYCAALIYKNGSVTKAMAVSRFINDYDPSIKTIVFDSEKDLRNKLLINNI